MFDWDRGNIGKNLKHNVHDWEIEEIFNDPLMKAKRLGIINGEERIEVLGRVQTNGRYLRVVFTPRRGLIRPISAKDMKRQERRRYLRK
ncbi:BrnT family toxin [Candidatus Poribacteria bacterium]|nr:BrnT family toxin [Candidatus Poribacteria bacterium]